ncbi:MULTISPECIES: hypothetical protein [Cysteiniphilum]|uniref:PAS domain-containing protein n=1 Tax=Cysteiniphilum litorale TaxID=2056700 RepID=A0A8J2Z384_9GAMM|nr:MULTISPECIES: hypothetical protein [Cysteiniphilum]GGF93341.1 hypothetical protein GCM10010995_08080 [Cysteiniphilum litorale]
MDKISFFELDNEYRLISMNQRFMDDIKLKEKDLLGKTALEIPSKKAFQQMYDLGNQEAILSKGISVRKDMALFNDGVKPIITTKKYINHNNIYIRGFYFPFEQNATEVSGKKIIINNYLKEVKLSALNFYVLSLKCSGMTNTDIAQRVFRAESTIRNMILDMFCTFGVYDIVTLSRYYFLGEWLNHTSIKFMQQNLNTLKG